MTKIDPLLSNNATIVNEERYQQIDEAIEKHHHSILALKSERNDMSLLHRLPPEIIGMIFSFNMVNSFQSIRVPAWVGLTQTSRHLRNIIVNTPSLWTYPSLFDNRWTEEMLKRSKDASLHIECKSLTFIYMLLPGLLPALQHGARIKVLSLSAFQEDLWDQVLQHLPAIAPRLESLRIHAVDRSKRVSIPQHVLCETNRLRRLELIDCDFNWNSHSHLLRSLTRLCIANLAQHSRPTEQQFMDALKEMPFLELLFLEDALPIDTIKHTSRALGHNDVIYLNALRSMTMESPSTELEAFFSYVVFPSTAHVHVKVAYPANTNAASNASFKRHTTSLSGLVSHIARSYSDEHIFEGILVAWLENYDSVHVNLFPPTAKSPDRTALLKLTFMGNFCQSSTAPITWNAKDVITNVFNNGLPLQHIKVVYLANRIPGFDAGMIAATLGKLHKVDWVKTKYGAERPFLDALNPNVPGETLVSFGSDLATNAPFPCLSSITLLGPSFRNPARDPVNDLTTGVLKDCLIRRLAVFMGIRHLHLKRCIGLQMEDVASLMQIVPDVEWDGQEMIDHSYLFAEPVNTGSEEDSEQDDVVENSDDESGTDESDRESVTEQNSI